MRELKYQVVVGTDQAKAALREVDHGFDQVDAGAQKAGQSIDRTDALLRKLGMTERQIAGEREKLAVLSVHALDRIAKGVTTVNQEYGKWSREQERLATATKQSASVIESSLASVGRTVMAVFAIDRVASFTKEIITTATHIKDLSTQLNIGVQAVAQLSYVASQGGTTIETFAGAIRQMTTHLGEGQDGAVGALRKLGLEHQALVQQRPEAAFFAIADAIAAIANPMEQQAIGTKIFGEQWTAVAGAIRGDIRSIIEEGEDLGAIMRVDTIEALARVSKAWDRTFAAMQGWAARLLVTVSDVVAELARMAEIPEPWSQKAQENAVAFTPSGEQLAKAQRYVAGQAWELGTTPMPTDDGWGGKFGWDLYTWKKPTPPLPVFDFAKGERESIERQLDAQIRDSIAAGKKAAADAAKAVKDAWKKTQELFEDSMKALAQFDRVERLQQGLPNMRPFDVGPGIPKPGMAEHYDTFDQYQMWAWLQSEKSGQGLIPNNPWITQHVAQSWTGPQGNYFGDGRQVVANSQAGFAKWQRERKQWEDDQALKNSFWGSQRGQYAAAGLGVAGSAITGAIAGGDQYASMVGAGASAVGGIALAGTMSTAALAATTMGIGAAAVGVYMLAKHFTTVSKEVKQAREEVNAFQKSLTSTMTAQQVNEAAGEQWAATAIVIRDAYDRMGYSAAEAEKMTLDLWNTDRPDAARAAMARINDVVSDFRAVLAGVNEQMGDLLGQADTLGQRLPQSLLDALNAAAQLGDMTDENARLIAKLTQAPDVDFAKFEQAADRYGINRDALGRAYQQNRTTTTAQQMVDDLDLLHRGGASMGTILHGMREEISALVTDSLKFGTELPGNMQPWIEELLRTKQLVDENGEAITDITRLNFGEDLQTTFQNVGKAIQDLIDTLKGPLSNALDEIGRKKVTPTVDLQLTVPDRQPEGQGGNGGEYYRHGGVVYAAQGWPFVPKGTDTVPAMLTPGEGVLSLRGMAMLGRLNSGMSGGLGRDIDYDRLGAAVARALRHSPLKVDVDVDLDGRSLARRIVPHIGNELEFEGAWR